MRPIAPRVVEEREERHVGRSPTADKTGDRMLREDDVARKVVRVPGHTGDRTP